MEATSAFQKLYTGRLWSVMSWDQLTAFWGRIDTAAGWYLYAVGEAVPTVAGTPEQVRTFIERVDHLLRDDHRYDYCSIVYADDLMTPSFIKIYDPNNLGVSCGFSDNPPLPGWILSQVAPEDLQADRPPPESRRRWWKALFS
jgi:hypothetical protein